MFSGILESIPFWNSSDPVHPVIYIVSAAFVAIVFGAALLTALRNPGYLRKR